MCSYWTESIFPNNTGSRISKDGGGLRKGGGTDPESQHHVPSICNKVTSVLASVGNKLKDVDDKIDVVIKGGPALWILCDPTLSAPIPVRATGSEGSPE
jgi:hypothetical protein